MSKRPTPALSPNEVMAKLAKGEFERTGDGESISLFLTMDDNFSTHYFINPGGMTATLDDDNDTYEYKAKEIMPFVYFWELKL